MVSTVIFLVLFLVLLLSSVVLWALFLRLGLWWAKTPNVSAGRVIFTTGTVFVLQFTINLLILLAPTSSNTQSIFLALVELVAAVMIPCMVITRFFKVRFLRALQAWLPTLLAPAIMIFCMAMFPNPFGLAPSEWIGGPFWGFAIPVCSFKIVDLNDKW